MTPREQYRDEDRTNHLLDAIRECVTQPWTVMVTCGGQTHTLVRHEIDRALPHELSLVHGPGSPACVTLIETIDAALAIAGHPGTVLCAPGELLRVPGSRSDLLKAQATGADVRLVYSPLDAVTIAQENPECEVVLFVVGYEASAPSSALAVYRAREARVGNFSVLAAHLRLPRIVEAMFKSPTKLAQACLVSGHACTVTDYTRYAGMAQRYGVPVVVAGHDPEELLHGIYLCVRQLEEGRAELGTSYRQSVGIGDYRAGLFLVKTVFEACSARWRGLGEVALSGLRLRPRFADFDGWARFGVPRMEAEPARCLDDSVLRGERTPRECPAFGNECRPEHPSGASMVSAEGACAAYFRYRRQPRHYDD